MWFASVALLLNGAAANAQSNNPIDWAQIPAPACPTVKGGGDGHSPDPLTVFNQYVELRIGALSLARHRRAGARTSGRGRKLQPYFDVDTGAHPWLGGAHRKRNPVYLIEGTTAYWRAYNGSYGEIAAHARVQFKTDADGEIHQVISLKVIPELSLIPRRE